MYGSRNKNKTNGSAMLIKQRNLPIEYLYVIPDQAQCDATSITGRLQHRFKCTANVNSIPLLCRSGIDCSQIIVN